MAGSRAIVAAQMGDRGDALLNSPAMAAGSLAPLSREHAADAPDVSPSLLAAHDTAVLHALCLWRLGQSIYRLDPLLAGALHGTQLGEGLPTEVFYRLPEWCLYLWVGNPPSNDAAGVGYFVHLEHNLENGRPELRLIMDYGEGWSGLLAYSLYLDRPTLAESLADSFAAGQRAGALLAAGGESELSADMRSMIERATRLVLPYLLYLACENADLLDPEQPGGQPRRAQPTTVKGRERWLAAGRVRLWDVGYRVGRRLQEAYLGDDTDTSESGIRVGPRPHVRRAHWHTYLVGSGRQERRLRWLHPVLVAAGGDPELLIPALQESPQRPVRRSSL
jgi:hypothetical protein